MTRLGRGSTRGSRTGACPLGATLSANADVTIKQTLMSGGVAYRVVEGSTPVDLIGGLRFVTIQVEAIST